MFGQLHPVPSDIKMADLLEYERGNHDHYCCDDLLTILYRT
jgi:hypothetical protein